MEKLYLPFYYTWEEITSELPDEDFGKLVRAILIFSKNGKITQFDSSAVASIAYKFITDTIRRSQKNSEAGRKGMAVRWGNNAVNNNDNNSVNNKPITINRNINTNTNISTNTNKDTPPTPSKSGSDRFDLFWRAYPKKIGKAYAKKCFDKLNPSAELTERMIKAIEEQKRSLEWKRDNGQYIPNPSTWLNQGRWDDELRRDPTDHTYTQEEQDRMGEAAMRQMDKWFGEDN